MAPRDTAIAPPDDLTGIKDGYEYGFHDSEKDYAFKAKKGLDREVVEGIHPHDIAEICNRQGVCIRAGHHCAQPLMRRLGVPATARASFQVYNTRDDVDRLVDSLNEARSVFGA